MLFSIGAEEVLNLIDLRMWFRDHNGASRKNRPAEECTNEDLITESERIVRLTTGVWVRPGYHQMVREFMIDASAIRPNPSDEHDPQK